jgi:hypothetical protein
MTVAALANPHRDIELYLTDKVPLLRRAAIRFVEGQSTVLDKIFS